MSPTVPFAGLPIAGLLLAAGASRRLGTPKQLIRDVHGVALVVRAAQQLLDAGCRPVVVVTGARADEVQEALRDAGMWSVPAGESPESNVLVVHNTAFADGMGRSIACGVSALAADPLRAPIAAVLIAACDMPTVSTSHLRALLSASANGAMRVASEYVARESADGGALMRGIPALLPRRDWDWLAALSADRGAKPLLMETETVTVPLSRGTFDLDTPTDVAAWRAESASDAT